MYARLALLRSLLAICENADASGAHFGNANERAGIIRAELNGYVTVLRSERHELYAALTPAGHSALAELRRANV